MFLVEILYKREFDGEILKIWKKICVNLGRFSLLVWIFVILDDLPNSNHPPKNASVDGSSIPSVNSGWKTFPLEVTIGLSDRLTANPI